MGHDKAAVLEMVTELGVVKERALEAVVKGLEVAVVSAEAAQADKTDTLEMAELEKALELAGPESAAKLGWVAQAELEVWSPEEKSERAALEVSVVLEARWEWVEWGVPTGSAE